MDIRVEVEKLVNNESFLEVMRTTIPFLHHLKSNNVSLTETVFRHYVDYILSSSNIDKTKKESIEFVLRDHFSYFSSMIEMPALEPTVESQPTVAGVESDSDEITDEFIAKLRGDEPEVQEPEPPDWFLELYKIGKDSEDV